jgi:hypothetical protein
MTFNRIPLCLLAMAFADFLKSTSLSVSDPVAAKQTLCVDADVLQRILCLSQSQPKLPLVDILRSEIVCSRSHSSPCPVFLSNELSKDPLQIEKNFQMWHAKRMDIAAVRVLGCAIVPSYALRETYDNTEEMLRDNSMCRLQQKINLLLPLVEYHVDHRLLDRKKFLQVSTNNGWYQSFGYNPMEVNDSRLAYEAPAFTSEEWMKFCFREITRQSNRSELPLPQSRAWCACNAFATSTFSRNYHHGMPKCFDVPVSLLTATPEQLTALLLAYGSNHREYIEQCRLNFSRISDDPWSLRNLARDVFYVLRDRWNAVQSVYELAIYETHKDIQRADEFCETLQWNTCHQSIEYLHLFSENVPSSFDSATCHPFHDPCKKVKVVNLGKRLHYKDALMYANTHLSGRVVMITNADIAVSDGFDSMPNLNEFLKKNHRMFALSRLERPSVS